MSTQILDLGTYHDHRIRRRDYDDDLGWYYNATDACDAHGKLWGHYWRSKEAKEYAETVSADIHIRISVKGGESTTQGTWVHEDIFLHLAQWLSPKFHLWCNRQIKAIIQGRTVAHREHAEFEMIKHLGTWVLITKRTTVVR